VTLYGLIDTDMAFASGAHTGNTANPSANAFSLNSGGLSTSRWGLRGNEDLGGGLSAVFDIENGFTVNNGQAKNGGDLFGRQAWVGLSSKQYGQVTLGRQYDFIVDYVAPLSATGSGFGGNFAAHPFDNDNLDNDLRLNNSIKFSSIAYGGFKAGAMYAFSNQAGGAGNNNAYSLGASYGDGPITVAAAYLQLNRVATAGGATNTTGAASTTDSNWISYGGNQQIYTVGAQYKFSDKSQVGVVYSHSVTYNIGNGSSPSLFGDAYALTGSSIKFDNFEINGRYFVRSDFSVGASYTYTMGAFGGGVSGAPANPHWNQVMLQADYQLSPRTDVYLVGVYQRVGGGNGIQAFNAGVYNMTQSNGNQQAVAAVGMRHRF
jgi:predicted porin